VTRAHAEGESRFMPSDPVTITTAAPPADSIDLSGLILHVGVDRGTQPVVTVEEAIPDILEIRITGVSAPATVTVDWQLPINGATCYWQPDWAQRRHLPAEWSSGRWVSPLRSAPVGSLVDATDRNVATWALSATTQRVRVRREGIREEAARFRGTIVIPVPAVDGCEMVLRMDRRPVPYWQALSETAAWWDHFLAEPPMDCPQTGRAPVYCTWYAMHQELTASRVEEAAKAAVDLGFASLIVDDGWQTEDVSRGYWYCGDWEVATGKMGNLAEHVAQVRALGVAYLLWLAPPLLGRRSPARARFADRVLGSLSAQDADVLDPRYPQVRDHLTAACVRLLDHTAVDGFKLDFLDAWLVDDPPPAGPGADVADVESAVGRWLLDLRSELTARRPDVLLEFRQNYTGPALHRYANLFRAADCPMDLVDNRTRTVDLRLLLPGRTVHSDPILWNVDEPAQLAAEQLLSVLFSVPQVSVSLSALPPEHREMLAFWLRFHREHVTTLLDGVIAPTRPDLSYPLVRSRGAGETVVAAYARLPVELSTDDGPAIVVVNAAGRSGLVLDVARGVTVRVEAILDHRGRRAADPGTTLSAGLHTLPVPRSGLAQLALLPA